VETESRYLFWAKVLSEYRGSGKSLDIHSLEATPGTLRVAEANFGWNLSVQFLLVFLFLAAIWGAYVVAPVYIPNMGTSSRPQSPLGVALFFGVPPVTVVILGLSLGSRRRFGRFILAGAFRHSRDVHSLVVVKVEAMRTPRLRRLHCRAGGRDLTVVVSVRPDRLRAALLLAGQRLDLLP
jgi:hypothetical protein